eukprot:6869865-Lingulodinium_polyedra.AAC.1
MACVGPRGLRGDDLRHREDLAVERPRGLPEAAGGRTQLSSAGGSALMPWPSRAAGARGRRRGR